MRRRLPFRVVGGLLIAVALAGAALPRPAAAQDESDETVGIRLVDAPSSRVDDPRAKIYIVDHVAPGTTIKRRVEVNNGSNEPQTIQLYAAAADVSAGAFRFADGRVANDLSRWTSVDPSSVTLAPRTTGLATVTVAVPPNASAGEQYAVVWAELRAPAPDGGGIAAVNRVGVRIYLSVGPGGEPPTDFEVTALQGRRSADGSPLVAATVHNTGGRALDLSGELRLTNGPGGLTAGPFSATLGTTLGPGETEPVLVTLDKSLPRGPWDAAITMLAGTTTREATATITFPEAAGTSGRAVATEEPGDDGPRVILLVVVVGVGLLFLLLLLLLLRRRRRRPRGRHSKGSGGSRPPYSGFTGTS
ncbi:MAG TPA: hypothetical protein VHM89_03115 [Acidimicrobiales bacterium]|nr:hypothetical protein [Acidimicrobiales bacterium]